MGVAPRHWRARQVDVQRAQQPGEGPSRSRCYADWTERIAKGEVPPAPPRPKGIERNLVVTLWDVGDDHSFMHDEIATDKNHPTVNANGPIYAVSAGHGQLVVVDPKEHSTFALDIPTREPSAEVPSRFPAPNRPSLFWGNEHLWAQPALQSGRSAQPDARQQGPRVDDVEDPRQHGPVLVQRPDQQVRRMVPAAHAAAGRRRSTIRKTEQFTLIDTCYATHHLQFDNDANETVYFNELTGPIFGWIDTKVYDETKDEQKAGGWCGQVLDTNGDGKITRPWNVPDGRRPAPPGRRRHDGRRRAPDAARRVDPKLDTMVSYSLYGVIPSPVDDSVWGVERALSRAIWSGCSAATTRRADCKTQIFKVPDPGFDPRGVDIDSNGVVWTALAGQQPPGQLRPPQVQGPERPGEDRRQPVPGRLDAVSRRPARSSGAPKSRPTSTITTGWTSTTSRDSARTRRSRPGRTRTRCSR